MEAAVWMVLKREVNLIVCTVALFLSLPVHTMYSTLYYLRIPLLNYPDIL